MSDFNEAPYRETGFTSASPNLLPTYVAALQSPEAFRSYADEIQTRLQSNASQRKRFLEGVISRLNDLLGTALAVNDTALYNELWQCRQMAQQMITNLQESLPREVAPRSEVPVPLIAQPPKLIPLDAVTNMLPYTPTPPPIREVPYMEPVNNYVVHPPYAPQEARPDSTTNELRPPRRSTRPLVDIEADAIRQREQLRIYLDAHPLRNEAGELSIPHGLQLRSLICRQRKLEEEAGDVEVAEVTDLRNDLWDAMKSAGDTVYTVGQDYTLEVAPTVFQWGELVERYEEMARAFEAFIWWHEHSGDLTLMDVQPLAEAVAAIQGRFNRLLYRVSSRDQFQQQLYEDLRLWAKEAQCYLYSLRPKVPIDELSERASTLDEAWDKARQPVLLADQRLKTLEHLGNLLATSGFGEEPQRDAERLRIVLQRCKELRVPAQERRLRDPLVTWTALMETDDAFRDVLREVCGEWERRMDTQTLISAPLLNTALTGLEAEVGKVRSLLQGKVVLMIGGVATEDIKQHLTTLLGAKEILWENHRPTATLEDFEADIRRADAVILLTQYSRKEWLEAQSLCAVDGKLCYRALTVTDFAHFVRTLSQ
ncbi:MAG: hypothetical protein NT023_25845 [Armatimonadetes bacterium]|nr:hypothetical protein [Armatimonadota bacterium]